ncbi:MAG: DoxX family protein [Deinococcota bacterium]
MKIIKLILHVLLIAVFLFFGTMKVIGVADMVTAFESFGYADWFMRLTGTIEIIAATCLMLAFWRSQVIYVGGLLIVGLTAGAVYSHVFRQGSVGEAIPPFIVGSVMVVVVLLYRRSKYLQVETH